MPKESRTSGEVGLQVEHLGQIRAWINRASVLRLHRVDHRSELPVLEDHHVDTLLHQRLHPLHHLVAVVPHAHVHGYPLALMVQLLVQGNLELQIAGAQEEILADHGARLTALLRRGVLDFSYAHGHRAPLDERWKSRRGSLFFGPNS